VDTAFRRSASLSVSLSVSVRVLKGNGLSTRKSVEMEFSAGPNHALTPRDTILNIYGDAEGSFISTALCHKRKNE